MTSQIFGHTPMLYFFRDVRTLFYGKQKDSVTTDSERQRGEQHGPKHDDPASEEKAGYGSRRRSFVGMQAHPTRELPDPGGNGAGAR